MRLIPDMLIDAYKMGYSKEDLKECVVKILSPYFVNKNALYKYWCEAKLLSVFEFTVRYHYDESFPAEMEWVLKIYREAFARNARITAEVVSNDVDSFTQKENIMWSINKQKLSDDKDPEETAIYLLRHIGDVLEIATKHLTVELWSLIQIIENNKTDCDLTRKLDFGVVVNNIISKGYLSDMLLIGPNSLKISDWRNVAYHHTYRFINQNKIICTYGKKQNIIEITLEELNKYAHKIIRMANVMSMARSCFLYDYSEQLSVAADEEIVEEGVLSLRTPMVIEGVRISLLSQGFYLESVDEKESEVIGRITDIGIGDTTSVEKKRSRWIHASQFLVYIWSIAPREKVIIEYYTQDKNLEFICSVNGEMCDQVYNQKVPLKTMAAYVDMQVV